jgi:ribosome biogenesis GTPase A
VDIFDLRGSILRNLKGIVGNNPLVIAANKVDLLPPDVSMLRLTNWIHTEIKQVCGYQSARADRDKTAGRQAMSDEDLDRYLDEESGIGSAGSAAGGSAGSGEEKLSAKERKARREEKEANTLRRADVHLVSCQTGTFLCLLNRMLFQPPLLLLYVKQCREL